MAPKQQWFYTLRLSIRQEHVKGWSVQGIGAGKSNSIGLVPAHPYLGGPHPKKREPASGVEGH